MTTALSIPKGLNVIRPHNRQLKIGWLIPTVGTFGAVREMVEVSNVLIGLGHKVYIYHPDGSACKWLDSWATCRKISFLPRDPLDVLIGIVDWQTELYQDLVNAPAKIKAICLLGFAPTEEMAKALRQEIPATDKAQRIIIDAMQRKYILLADSSWQLEWIRENVGYPAGPSFGGINLDMFHPVERSENEKIKIIYSGDPRPRKGTDTVEKAIEIIKLYVPDQVEFDFYWGKKFNQLQLVEFLQNGDIFLDGHRRAGWCNPVAEAIACGAVPVCTNIGATRDFAINEKTALVVEVDDADMMAASAIDLVQDSKLRTKLSKSGLAHIKKFSYAKVVPHLESMLTNFIYDKSI